MFAFDAYKKEVLADYEAKLARRKLPTPLIDVTPGSLKAESMRICEERFDEKDAKMLREFFGKKDGATGYYDAIRTRNADPFRPLVSFLRDRSIDTNNRNIELLAWLIDYEQRPHVFEYPKLASDPPPVIDDLSENNPVQTDKVDSGIGKKEDDNDDSQITPEPDTWKFPIRESLYAAAVILVLFTVIYFWPSKSSLTGTESCMYWDKDHYQPASCALKIEGAELIAFDSLRVAHFKKIMSPDTLTADAIGKAWYIRMNGGYDFYTDSGTVPGHPDRRLLRVSARILDSSYPRR